MTTKTGTIQKIGLEGGLLALVTDAGESFELLDPPRELRPGARARLELDMRGADVSIGMIGQAARVTKYEIL
ncbi:MAG: hypothetical protein ACK6CU_24060 [Deltaproteobacteria bacterium]|jgi:hypothetical protein